MYDNYLIIYMVLSVYCLYQIRVQYSSGRNIAGIDVVQHVILVTIIM